MKTVNLGVFDDFGHYTVENDDFGGYIGKNHIMGNLILWQNQFLKKKMDF